MTPIERAVEDGLNREQLRAFAQTHVNHFKQLIDSGDSGDSSVRVYECEHYLAIWTSVLAKVSAGWPVTLSPAEHGEVFDAITSGDYDDLIEKHAEEGSGG